MSIYKSILGMIPPKVAQIGTPMVVVCKDDELVRTRKKTSARHLIDFEAELKKSNMITQQQMAECLGVPRWFVQIKLCELVKKGIAKRHFIGHHIGRQAFFLHVENDVNQ
jgi:hypothetical protein